MNILSPMKKLALFLAALLVSLNLPAQEMDRQLLNHLGMGITAGLDGAGIELALPISPYVQLRGGYSVFPYTHKVTVNGGTLTLDDGMALDLSQLPVALTLWKGGTGKVMLDLFPGKATGFHFIVGAYIGAGKIGYAKVDMREMLEEEAWGTASLSYKDISLSTDKNGYVHVDAKAARILPYAGIGLGRALRPDKSVCVSLELGALITRGIRFQTYDFPEQTTSVIRSENLVNSSGTQMDGGWINKISDFPVCPMLKLNFFFRLF